MATHSSILAWGVPWTEEPVGGGIVVKLCLTFATPWTVACQAPLSMGFCRQDCWSGGPFPSAGDLPNPGIKPRSPALQSDSLPTELWSNPLLGYNPCGHKKVRHNLVTKQQATLLLAKEESVGSDRSSLKSNKQAKLVERKNCFISDASNWGGWWQTSVQRLTLPRPAPSGKRFLDRRAGRATCRNSTVSSDSHLQIGHQWSDQRHLDCFRYS